MTFVLSIIKSALEYILSKRVICIPLSCSSYGRYIKKISCVDGDVSSDRSKDSTCSAWPYLATHFLGLQSLEFVCYPGCSDCGLWIQFNSSPGDIIVLSLFGGSTGDVGLHI